MENDQHEYELQPYYRTLIECLKKNRKKKESQPCESDRYPLQSCPTASVAHALTSLVQLQFADNLLRRDAVRA